MIFIMESFFYLDFGFSSMDFNGFNLKLYSIRLNVHKLMYAKEFGFKFVSSIETIFQKKDYVHTQMQLLMMCITFYVAILSINSFPVST